MKLNNKGFALTSIIYMLIVLFVMVILLILANLTSRKVVFDKIKNDVKTELDQEVTIINQGLPYFNIDTGIYYESLDEAISRANNTNTIRVMKNVTDISTVTIAQDKEVKLDLNGKEVTLNKTITNNGAIDIYTSEDNGKIITSALRMIDNNGTFTTNGFDDTKTLELLNTNTSTSARISATYENAQTTFNNNTTISFDNAITGGSTIRYLLTNLDGTITINGATLNNKLNSDSHNAGILNSSGYPDSRIIINSGTIDTSGIAIYNIGGTGNTTQSPAVEINGTTLSTTIKSSASNAIANNSATGMISIKGGSINTIAGVTIKNNSTGIIDISGGNISYTGTGTSVVVNNASTGTINISGGEITGNSTTISNPQTGRATINVSGGIISGQTSGIVAYEGNTTIRGGTISGGTTNGVYINGNGTLLVTGGEISGGRFGITSAAGNTSITLGDDDGTVNPESPLIFSTDNSASSNHGTGIYIVGTGSNLGVLNFYDGIVMGPTKSIYLNGTGATMTLPQDGNYEADIDNRTQQIDGVTYKIGALKPNFIQSGATTILDATNHGTGSTWTAITGTNGTVNNGTWGSNYLQFDGTSTWVNLGQINHSNQTIEATISFDEVRTEDAYIISNLQQGGLGLRITKNTRSLAGLFYTKTADGTSTSANVSTASGTPLTPGEKYHVAMTYNNQNRKIYINGVKVIDNTTASSEVVYPNNNTVMVLGGDPNGNNVSASRFKGKIYSAAVYNRALSDAEIAQNARAGLYRANN